MNSIPNAPSGCPAEGIVLRAGQGIYRVQAGVLQLDCRLRGNLKKDLEYSTSESQARRVTRAKPALRRDPVAVGDRVRFSKSESGEGVIEYVLPRESAFSRLGFRGREQTIVANLSQLVIVFACAEPNPDLWRLDRFLASAESAGLEALLVANKADLTPNDAPERLFAEYVRAGYDLLPVSARSGANVASLKRRLEGRISAFAGPSGVGKSSLLNAIQPGLSLRTTEIGSVTFKGRHTTTAAELLPLDGGGWVADTPGLRQLELTERDQDEVAAAFREFRPFLGRCRFRDCAHQTEPGCALAEAAQAGTISLRRLESFRQIAAELVAAS